MKPSKSRLKKLFALILSFTLIFGVFQIGSAENTELDETEANSTENVLPLLFSQAPAQALVDEINTKFGPHLEATLSHNATAVYVSGALSGITVSVK